jgi:hypothetical protein
MMASEDWADKAAVKIKEKQINTGILLVPQIAAIIRAAAMEAGKVVQLYSGGACGGGERPPMPSVLVLPLPKEDDYGE